MAAPSTPASSWLRPPVNSTSCGPWAAPGCAGTTRLLSRSGSVFKNEYYHRHVFTTINEARRCSYAWIDGWYNARRRHSKIDYISPLQYEQRLAEQAEQSAPKAA
ncbi:hypothetical protein C0Z11_10080 [Acidipropionibacterium jensenii]|nr:hypothetical protein C0Z11_10080 [Acidipropionibacterium jensenii]